MPWTVVFPILDADGDMVTGAANLDSEYSANGDTFGDCANEATEIATNSGMYYLSLTAAEMSSDIIAVIVKTSTAGAKTTPIVLYPRKLVTIRADTAAGGAVGSITLDAAASAQNDWYNGMLCVATIDGNIEARIIRDYVGATNIALVSPNWNVAPDNDDTYTLYLPEGIQVNQANLTHIAGAVNDSTAAQLGVNVVQISADGTAADNAESFFDGTGYAGTNNTIPTVTTLTNAVTLANGAHGGGAATITLLTPIVANTTQIEGADATDQINAEVDAALNTAIPALPTANSINERIKAIDDKLPSKAYLTGSDNSDGDVEMDDATGNYPGTVATVTTVTNEVSANVTKLSGDGTAADNAESFFDGTGYAGTNNTIPTVTTVTNEVSANVTKLSGDGTAADNAESFFDGTGYAGTNNTIPTVTTLTNPVTLANGAHGGGAATITLLTPIVANTTQIEGIDATDQIDTRVTAVLNTAIPALPTANSPFERLVTLDNHITADYTATEQSAIDLLDDAAGGLLDIHTDVGNVAAGVWDVALAAHVNAGSTGQAQDANIGRYNYNKTTSVEQIQTSLGVVVRTYTVTDTPLVTSKA